MSDLRLCSAQDKKVSPYYVGLMRILIGLYFLIQAVDGVRAADELQLPKVLAIGLTFAALLLTWGIFSRTAAFVLWLGFAWLYAVYPLLKPAGAELIGVLLLFLALLPRGGALQWCRLQAEPDWKFPAAFFLGAWILLAVYFIWNAFLKCQSPSWIQGVALKEILQSVLVEPGSLRKVLLILPDGVLRFLSFALIAVEFLPLLCWIRLARLWVWMVLFAAQVFWFLLLNDGMANLGIVLFLLWIFDQEWLPARKAAEGKSLVLYDGVCGLCNGTVQFLLAEDHSQNFVFSALQGKTAESVLGASGKSDPTSIVYVRDWKTERAQRLTYSDAAMAILEDLGGFWKILSFFQILPRAFRDVVYRAIAKNRYRFFGKHDACPLPAPGVRERFLD